MHTLGARVIGGGNIHNNENFVISLFEIKTFRDFLKTDVKPNPDPYPRSHTLLSKGLALLNLRVSSFIFFDINFGAAVLILYSTKIQT